MKVDTIQAGDYQILLDEFRYTASPTFHIADQAMILMHIQRGFPTLILPQFEEGAVLRWMQSGRLTGVFLVPTMIRRSQDMIIRGGENIYPIEIETVIADYPGVTAVAVVGQPDEHWGEIVVAFVTASAEAVIEQEEVRRFCRQRLASYKVPAVVTVIPEMPLNASGKILKRELRARLRDG